MSTSYSQLGNETVAENAAEDLLRIWPTVEEDYYQMGLVNWIFGQPELMAQINEGLRKAGINIVVPEKSSD